MFESIVSKIANVIRTTVRTLGVATRKTPWVVPVVILTWFLAL